MVGVVCTIDTVWLSIFAVRYSIGVVLSSEANCQSKSGIFFGFNLSLVSLPSLS